MRALPCLVAVIALLACVPSGDAGPDTFENAVGSAVVDLCDERLVLMGEASDHGRGEALALKAQIARELIETCGFDALLFESGYYDFARLYLDQRGGGRVPAEHISSSLGGIWNQYGEVAELIPFLTAQVNSGELVVGGVDFNLGTAGAFYSIDAMPADLADLIDAGQGQGCALDMRRLIYSSYGREGPQRADIDGIRRCTDQVLAALGGADPSGLDAAIYAQMTTNMRAYADALLAPRQARLQARERAFFENFNWWRRQRPADAKIIVWGASVHMARGAPGHGLFGDVETFGALVNEAAPEGIHFLNFVAVSGSYRFLDREEQALPEPEPGSVEALYADLEGYRFLDREAVEALGVRPSSIYGGRPVSADISAITDSLIVIARERPPAFLN